MQDIKTTGLNPKQKKLWAMISTLSGVVMLKGKAGVAKSATCKGIAENVLFNGKPLNFIDLRLSQMDETHFGFPYRDEKEGVEYQVMDYALPAWFREACEKPTLINFEELNRCSQDVQNAALEILNERTLHGHKLPDHVYMIATGNMGEEDGCSVQEFDNALINRLILVDFDLSFKEWCEYFANENVTDLIVSYLTENTEHYYSSVEKIEVGQPFATPRSWTNLSECVKCFGNDIEAIKKFVEKYGASYIGTPATVSFVTWLNEALTVTVHEVLNGTDKVGKLSRSEINKVIQDIERDYVLVEDLSDKQIQNLITFFSYVEEDLKTSYVSKVFNKGFEPSTNCRPEQSDDFEANRDLIRKEDPDYKQANTYAYLKHSVFMKAIIAFKTGYGDQNND